MEVERESDDMYIQDKLEKFDYRVVRDNPRSVTGKFAFFISTDMTR